MSDHSKDTENLEEPESESFTSQTIDIHSVKYTEDAQHICMERKTEYPLLPTDTCEPDFCASLWNWPPGAKDRNLTGSILAHSQTLHSDHLSSIPCSPLIDYIMFRKLLDPPNLQIPISKMGEEPHTSLGFCKSLMSLSI